MKNFNDIEGHYHDVFCGLKKTQKIKYFSFSSGDVHSIYENLHDFFNDYQKRINEHEQQARLKLINR